jgi:hypothetical protein
MAFFCTALQGTQCAFVCTFVHQKSSGGFLNSFQGVLAETRPAGMKEH